LFPIPEVSLASIGVEILQVDFANTGEVMVAADRYMGMSYSFNTFIRGRTITNGITETPEFIKTPGNRYDGFKSDNVGVNI
jgi:hypothetical protein